MGALYDEEVDIDDPWFEVTNDDSKIAQQLAATALDTPPGSVDPFPEYGFSFRSTILTGLTETERALLPLEVRGALEQEPSFVEADVTITGTADNLTAQCMITLADGSAVDFTPGS
jgi:hypothetical protein